MLVYAKDRISERSQLKARCMELLISEKLIASFKATFSSLKYPNFRIFLIGQCISLTGTWMQKTAQVWLVYTLTGSPLLVGLLGACQFLPILIFTLFAGVFVDRFPKRYIIIISQTVFMILGFALAVLVYLGIEQYWHILLITIIFGIAQSIDTPARQSFFIELVGKKDIMNGISLNATIFNLAKIVGPAVSGIVMVNLGIFSCFFINALSYIAVILGLFMIKTPNAVSPRAQRKVLQEVSEGLSYVRNNETLLVNSLIMGVICTFALNGDVIMPIFAKEVLDQGATAYTNLMSAAGIGSFIGAIAMAAIARFGIRKRLYLFNAIATACLQILMIFVHDYSVALVAVAVMGFINMSFMNLGNVIFQVNTLSEYRGRVMSVFTFLNQGSTPIGNLYAGTAMNLFGGIAGYPACGAATLLLLIPLFIVKRETLTSWVTERRSKNPQRNV